MAVEFEDVSCFSDSASEMSSEEEEECDYERDISRQWRHRTYIGDSCQIRRRSQKVPSMIWCAMHLSCLFHRRSVITERRCLKCKFKRNVESIPVSNKYKQLLQLRKHIENDIEYLQLSMLKSSY